ncbi:desampylase [Haloparvum sedimenti]|uniref:desampylase n=1 Tax=Haloparvum sedimenti TaxID=1678448 RepID=UPI0009B5CE6E|nr:desampylase [Haloparvum sedimenti]
MLRIDAAVRDDLIAHARDGVPEEVCGVLGGTRVADDERPTSDGTGRTDRAETSLAVENAAANARSRYEMAPAALLEAVEAIEDAGDDVVGFYHSHPRGPAEPSATDRDRATWDGYCYVIVSPTDGGADDGTDDGGGRGEKSGSDRHRETVRAWRWDASSGRFSEEPIVIE